MSTLSLPDYISYFTVFQDGFPHYGSNLRMEIATLDSGSAASSPTTRSSPESLYIRLLWNDNEISFPGYDAWCPLEVVVQKLHAGFLGLEDTGALEGDEKEESKVEEDLSATLNALDDLDTTLNEALVESDSEVDKR